MTEKPISKQITEKMISKLRDSDHFTGSILTILESIDLTNRGKVRAALSNDINDKLNEDTEA